jgi:hypothetical protein
MQAVFGILASLGELAVFVAGAAAMLFAACVLL